MFNKRPLVAGVSALAILAYSGASAADGPINGSDTTGADVLAASTVSQNKVIDWMSRRANDIGGVDGAGSFTEGASGIVHVQQNNGSATGLENGTAVQGGLIDHIGSVNSGAHLNLDTFENEIITRGADPFLKDFNDRQNTIGDESFGGFTGIASIQQNNGDANQIGISTAILATTGVQEGDGHHGSEVIGDTHKQAGKGAEAHDEEWNSMGVFADAVLDEDSDVLNSVANAFNGASGLFQVQQNNGNGNAIGSGTAVVSTGSFWGTLSGGVNVNGNTSDNAVVDVNVNRVNTIENAFTGASGSATVQQNNGHSNFMGAATSIVFGTSESGAALAGGLTNASLSNTVTNNAVQTDLGDNYNNSVAMAFNSYSGIAQVQQNNGNANGLASAVHVSVQTGNPASPPLPFGSGGTP